MLKYKALYKKMMDALKDAGMWIDWGEQLKEECPDTAKFLVESAKARLDTDFPTTYAHFKKLCDADEDAHCGLNEMVEEHMMDWYESMLNRIKRW